MATCSNLHRRSQRLEEQAREKLPDTEQAKLISSALEKIRDAEKIEGRSWAIRPGAAAIVMLDGEDLDPVDLLTERGAITQEEAKALRMDRYPRVIHVIFE